MIGEHSMTSSSTEQSTKMTSRKPATLPSGVQALGRIPFGPKLGIDLYQLQNGLRVLLLEDHAAPVIAYHTWFRVGSRNEREGKTGIAHLFEHLMFNETTSSPKGEFDRKLEEAGAESNASTWLDFTQYNISAPSESLDLVIGLESDRMQHLVLREPQVASEKEVVANERRYRVEDDVEGAVSELLWATAFKEHPYKWPTIGWMQDILGFTTADCEAFYRTYYSPDNASVILVGDFEPASVLQKIQNAYGQIAASGRLPDAIVAEPEQAAERVVEIRKPTMNEKLNIGYHSPPLAHADTGALNLLCEVMAGGRASRLHRKLVRELEIASEVRLSLGPFRDPGLLEVYATAREEHNADELLKAIDLEFEKLSTEEIAPQELERARARFELGLLHGLENAEGKASTIGFFECLLAEPNAAFTRLEALRSVTVSDLQRVARRYLDKKRRSVILVRISEEAAEQDGAEDSDDEEGDA
jgi:zinc protease